MLRNLILALVGMVVLLFGGLAVLVRSSESATRQVREAEQVILADLASGVPVRAGHRVVVADPDPALASGTTAVTTPAGFGAALAAGPFGWPVPAGAESGASVAVAVPADRSSEPGGWLDSWLRPEMIDTIAVHDGRYFELATQRRDGAWEMIARQVPAQANHRVVPWRVLRHGPSPSAPAAPAPPAARLALEGEGLRIFLVPSGRARPVPFGRPMAEVVAAVRPLAGGVEPEVAPVADCAITAATWPAVGLTLWFRPATRGGGFVGWAVAPVRTEEPSPHFTTAAGLGLGSTRRELMDAYDATVRRTTLGTEFSAGGLAGVLESDRPAARVTALWAGETCVAR